MNSTCIRTVFKIKSWNFTGTSRTPRERSYMAWWFYRSSVGVRHEGFITKKTWIRRAFAQFSKCNVETTQLRQPLPGTGRIERLTILPYPRRGQKWRVNHSKNVNATCIRTIFKIQSWNFTGTSMTPRDRSGGWRFYRTPRGVRNKGLITQQT